MKKKIRKEDGQKELPHFRYFWLTDYNPVSQRRKRRRIGAPNSVMRDLHARLIRFIRKKAPQMPNASAGRRGNSALKNVLRHRKKGQISFRRYFFLLDISSAYRAVDLETMTNILISLDPEKLVSMRDNVREFLKDYCFDGVLGGITTGGPASPDLFNLYCEVQIDRKLRELCEKYDLVYSRYIDDLTFSSIRPIGLKKRRAIRKVLIEAGFKISDRKAQVLDLRKGSVAINGIGIRLAGEVFLPRQMLSQIRGLLHRAIHRGDVAPALVHGKMGLLKSLTARGATRNRTEAKVFELYWQFRKLEQGRGVSEQMSEQNSS